MGLKVLHHEANEDLESAARELLKSGSAADLEFGKSRECIVKLRASSILGGGAAARVTSADVLQLLLPSLKHVLGRLATSVMIRSSGGRCGIFTGDYAVTKAGPRAAELRGNNYTNWMIFRAAITHGSAPKILYLMIYASKSSH